MTDTPDLHAAQPTFSDGELDILLRALSIEGDLRNERDRERALEALSAVLLDTAKSDQVLAALRDLTDSEGGPAADEQLFTGNHPTPVTRRAENPESARAVIDDAPSTGRILNAVHARKDMVERARAHFRRDDHETWPAGTTRRQALSSASADFGLDMVILTPPVPDDIRREHLRSFLVKAREALPERSLSLRERLVEAFDVFKGVTLLTSWQTAKFVADTRLHTVDVELRHGPRQWHLLVRFNDPTVIVQVANEHKTVIERDVAKSEPGDFSRSLLSALDNDVRSTQMALDAVQQAMAVEARALH